MCGRFTLRTPSHTIAEAFGVRERLNLKPRYNIAPTQQVLAVRRAAGGPDRKLARLRWGLIPSWAKDLAIGNRLINARAETVAEKPAFRAAFRSRRCLVPADGFYEWRKTNGRKQPYHFSLPESEVFAIAGLWEAWRSGAGEKIESVTLVTTDANAIVAPIHGRMPVILDPADYETWLTLVATDPEELRKLMRPWVPDRMVARPVGQRLNDPRNDDDSLIEEAPSLA